MLVMVRAVSVDRWSTQYDSQNRRSFLAICLFPQYELVVCWRPNHSPFSQASHQGLKPLHYPFGLSEFGFVYPLPGKSFLLELLFPVAQGSDIDMRGIAEGVWMTGMTYLQVRHASIRKNPPYLLKYRPRIRQVLKQIEGRNQITSGRVERKASLNIRHDQSTADFILTL